MTMVEPTRILPAITPENAHFWQGGANAALQFLRCIGCGLYLHPPTPICPRCHSRERAVVAVSGRGTVASCTINYQAWRPGLTVPYVIAVVELPEQAGLRLTTNIVNCAVDAVHIGMAVRAVFEKIQDVWLPLFQPVVGNIA